MTRLGGSGSSGVSEVAIKCQPGLPFLMAGLGLEDPLKNVLAAGLSFLPCGPLHR